MAFQTSYSFSRNKKGGGALNNLYHFQSLRILVTLFPQLTIKKTSFFTGTEHVSHPQIGTHVSNPPLKCACTLRTPQIHHFIRRRHIVLTLILRLFFVIKLHCLDAQVFSDIYLLKPYQHYVDSNCHSHSYSDAS